MKDVSIIIKTFERPEYLKRLVESIKKYYPDIAILVADDSENPKPIAGVDYHCLPYDVGVSAGRNFIVDKVNTKYFITVDDDWVFDQKTKVEQFVNIIENHDIDLLSGALSNSIPMECALLIATKGILTVLPMERPTKEEYKYCDYSNQFFIANTEKFKAFGGWDEELKTRGEHIELFLRAKKTLKVAFTPTVEIIHERGVSGSAKYRQFRSRDHLPIGMKKHGIKKLINFNGKEKTFD